MSYAKAEADSFTSDQRSQEVWFLRHLPRFDDRIPALPRPPPRSLHSTAAAATSTHVLDIYFKPEHEGQGIDLLSGDVKGQKTVHTEQCQASQSLFEGGRMACVVARQ